MVVVKPRRGADRKLDLSTHFPHSDKLQMDQGIHFLTNLFLINNKNKINKTREKQTKDVSRHLIKKVLQM